MTRFLVIDGYSKAARDELQAGGATIAATLYERMLLRWAPAGSSAHILFPADDGIDPDLDLHQYDGITWTGCSLCVNDDHKSEVQCQIELQRRAFAAGVPGFGSCWAAQIAVVAAGGQVAPNPNGREMGVARKIRLTEQGLAHPMYAGKPPVFDGFTSHDDEVTHTPDGASILASNPWTRVQAVHVVHEGTPFWGLQYHPEYDLHEMARLMFTRADKLVGLGLFEDRDAALRHVDDLEELHDNPSRKDLGWQLGIDADLLDPGVRQVEVKNWVSSLLALLLLTTVLGAQTNYDEAKVPKYTLPDPLSGVTSPLQWPARRGELMQLLEGHVYGRMPGRPATMPMTLTVDPTAMEGTATRKEVVIRFGEASDAPSMRVLVYVPNGRDGPAPAFLGLNFWGNHTISPDPGITKNPATRRTRPRGSRKSRWPVQKILSRGYALATVYYGDIDPDEHDGFKNGVHPLFPMTTAGKRDDDAWGSICAWAWGLSRAMDALVKDEDIDGERVAVLGHSRLGKTALWAGACDERFKLVISNNSGCGGAALSRRGFGETVQRINAGFPHWFCDRFKTYNGNEAALPVDQHTLIACIAPRACLVSSAEGDRWADPRGEFLSILAADPVYRMLGTEGLPATEMPKPGSASLGRLGYHIRPGRHDVTDADWEVFLSFADRVMRAK